MKWIGILEKRVTNPFQSFFKKLCVALLVVGPTRLETRSEACNILVLGCFGHVEPNRIMIVTPKPITKLGFGFGIIP